MAFQFEPPEVIFYEKAGNQADEAGSAHEEEGVGSTISSIILYEETGQDSINNSKDLSGTHQEASTEWFPDRIRNLNSKIKCNGHYGQTDEALYKS